MKSSIQVSNLRTKFDFSSPNKPMETALNKQFPSGEVLVKNFNSDNNK